MRTAAASNPTDLWEAWIDLENESAMLYVVGDVCTGRSKTAPVLRKKCVQGAAASHLILEVLPLFDAGQGRLAEVSYAELLTTVHQYQEVSICVGEEIVARIPDIELIR